MRFNFHITVLTLAISHYRFYNDDGLVFLISCKPYSNFPCKSSISRKIYFLFELQVISTRKNIFYFHFSMKYSNEISFKLKRIGSTIWPADKKSHIFKQAIFLNVTILCYSLIPFSSISKGNFQNLTPPSPLFSSVHEKLIFRYYLSPF